jgi:hypothetical protein
VRAFSGTSSRAVLIRLNEISVRIPFGAGIREAMKRVDRSLVPKYLQHLTMISPNNSVTCGIALLIQ